jgi:hypothetical protein
MTGTAAERIVVWTMRLLAACFAVVGTLFIVTPDGVISTIDDVGEWFGTFTPGPETEQKMWLGLAFAYMVVITGLALVVQADPARFRPLLLVLAAGKAASSLTAGAFFAFDRDVFIYLLNFLVDGSLVAVALWCWVLAGRIGAPREAPVATGPPGGDGASRGAEAGAALAEPRG